LGRLAHLLAISNQSALLRLTIFTPGVAQAPRSHDLDAALTAGLAVRPSGCSRCGAT
jgi:hypothetical protein